MGYYSSLTGYVQMTNSAYEKFVHEKLTSAFHSECPVSEYLDILDYDHNTQVLYIEGEGKMYADEELIALLARYKDLPGVDEVHYSGEESGDEGVYYIDIGRWCYLEAEIPPAPSSDSDKWRNVKVKKEEILNV